MAVPDERHADLTGFDTEIARVEAIVADYTVAAARMDELAAGETNDTVVLALRHSASGFRSRARGCARQVIILRGERARVAGES